jgi:rubredoxin
MKNKHHIKIILVITSLLTIFLFISGCGLDTNIQAVAVSDENQTVVSTDEQISEQQQDTNQNYEKWECIEKGCNYIYDPAIGDPTQGIEPGTKFEDLPSNWRCPVCNKGKDHFIKLQ